MINCDLLQVEKHEFSAEKTFGEDLQWVTSLLKSGIKVRVCVWLCMYALDKPCVCVCVCVVVYVCTCFHLINQL